tara:strand:+ start:2588 stop:3052 length:465 start_codon:yes stop_codon:yes gene_type:complete
MNANKFQSPRFKEGAKVRVVATSDIYEIIEYGSNPKEDLPKVGEILGLGDMELEAYLLFYNNQEGNDRVGYESKIISYLGILEGRPIQDISEAREELKHMGAIHLAPPQKRYFLRTNTFDMRKSGYTHEAIVVTAEPLSELVKDTFTEMGCELI